MFDIIVPTFNRYSDLKDFFKNLSILDKNLYTLWLVDDSSSLKDVSVIPKWDNIKFIELKKNIGQAGARNYAISLSNSPFIISLDDDAWFDNSSNVNLTKIKDAFSNDPTTGCLMFNVATPNSAYAEDIDEKLLALHVTCGCAYRRTALEQIGGFNSVIQGQGEESDLSLKLYKNGWNIRSLFSLHVFHNFNPETRSIDWYKKIRYRETRNCLIVVFLYYPWFTLLWFIPGKAISQLLFAVKTNKATLSTLKVSMIAILDFIKLIPSLLKKGRPCPIQVLKDGKNLFSNSL